MTDAATLAQAQLDAYNAHDVEAFSACFHENVVAELLPGGERLLSGMAELRAFYAERFANPDLHARLVNRITLGPVAIDREEVTGLAGGASLQVIAIYEIDGDKIRRIRFVRDS